jgi:hypothetical protein
MSIKLAIVLGSSTLLAPLAFPQISAFTLESKGNTIIFTFNTPRGSSAPIITGAPYSADQIWEQVRTLADGTHISHDPSVLHILRDSQGRTRTDRPLYGIRDPNTSISVVEIRDPVDGFYYILDEQNKVAHRFAIIKARPMPALALTVDSPRAHAPKPPKPASDATEPRSSVERLGSQWIEGVMAEGQRSTITWPAGTQGNDRPIVSVYEAWVSPDLHLEVRRKTLDPRNGETTVRLTNLSRAEPDPGLLQPPQDYTIVDEKGPFIMTVSRR